MEDECDLSEGNEELNSSLLPLTFSPAVPDVHRQLLHLALKNTHVGEFLCDNFQQFFLIFQIEYIFVLK